MFFRSLYNRQNYSFKKDIYFFFKMHSIFLKNNFSNFKRQLHFFKVVTVKLVKKFLFKKQLDQFDDFWMKQQIFPHVIKNFQKKLFQRKS